MHAIRQINHCLLDNSVSFPNIYSMDSDLSSQEHCYPPCEQLGLGFKEKNVLVKLTPGPTYDDS